MKRYKILLGSCLFNMMIPFQSEAMVMTRAQSDAFKDEVLISCQAPRAVQKRLDTLFKLDKDAARYLASHPKRLNMSGPALGRLRTQAEVNPEVLAELTRLKKRNNSATEALESNKTAQAEFYDRHGIRDLSPDGSTAALTTDAWDFVLRVPNCEWYDTYVSATDIPIKASKYQNVSRVFYGKQINDFIVQENLDRVYPFKQYLWHIPGRPAELSDENYLVVAEKIMELPAIKLNATRFNGLVKEISRRIDNRINIPEIYVKKTAERLVIQMVQVISYAALWDIKLKNVFLIKHNGVLKILFLDIEKPGLGGGADINFYHTHDGEVMSNMRIGFEGLADIFLSNEAKKGLIKRANDLDREKFEAEQKVVANQPV